MGKVQKAILKLEDISSEGFINLELLARQVVEGFITGLHKSPFHGFSVEFAEHRLYNNGDSIKNVDWKLYGRTDKLFVKRFEEETNLRCQLVLDVSSSMFFPENKLNKLIFSACSAAALMQLFKRQRDAFGLSYFSDTLEFSSAARSTTAHQNFLLSELQNLILHSSQNKRTALVSSLHELAEKLHKRSLVIIFTDLYESYTETANYSDLFAALQHLKHNKHEIIIFNVLDYETEINFNFKERPYHFIDIENGETIKLHPSLLREAFKESVASNLKELRLKCAQYSIDLIEADINAGFNDVLHSYLIKRNRMTV
ncbi:hypothetical protein ADIARSV_3944 [Arcticibacter svalbardensis MN12-7]|uniref:DUF58 domain-containing protein n=1 Tax=Arcticibacter svalbardensis MN12-7 TaxID=1150600 RepID=R9GMC9_9SPHI|nr:DUF58 domain-containing protein [Arcticibacter svalbardensis]EOR92856.1 hypothetical protein ADIARSV_3944 [Arcticibacter svalbardensis MN12-7]